ncbi:MAG TPA: glutathione S-transferase family protein [Candidatus Methylomirabilis sp.]|nr:glutathione S-transferase family protein [Candidatus Methylomirabilis sp.]
MGYLKEGRWHDGWYDTSKTAGEFVRAESQFRERVSADGSSGYKAEPGRYHLYVSLACPWAHRTIIFRQLKRLEDVISLSVTDPVMSDQGWAFMDGGGTLDVVNGFTYLHQAYTHTTPDYSGRVTVPVLWDRQTQRIVNNESSDIIRMLNSEFNAFTGAKTDFYPAPLRAEIDAINAFAYERINNGVYKAGFAGSQRVYESAVKRLFGAFDELEVRLGQLRYLIGDSMTEADWRLFTTLIRFDAVYVAHFKCNLRRIEDYPNLSNYLRDLYQVPGVAGTVNLDHIKRHYFLSHRHLNPSGLVPLGPILDFNRAHDRDRFAAATAKRRTS